MLYVVSSKIQPNIITTHFYKLVVIKSQLPTQTQMTHEHNILYMYVLHTIYKMREKEETTDTSNALLAGGTCTTTVLFTWFSPQP